MKGTNKMIHNINRNYVSITHCLGPTFVFDESDLIFKVTHYPSFLHTQVDGETTLDLPHSKFCGSFVIITNGYREI